MLDDIRHCEDILGTTEMTKHNNSVERKSKDVST